MKHLSLCAFLLAIAALSGCASQPTPAPVQVAAVVPSPTSKPTPKPTPVPTLSPREQRRAQAAKRRAERAEKRRLAAVERAEKRRLAAAERAAAIEEENRLEHEAVAQKKQDAINAGISARDGIVDASEYNHIQSGMSYSQVVAIIGEGKEMSSSDMAGYRTVMYMWQNPSGGANMNAMFQNDRLIQKAQFGIL